VVVLHGALGGHDRGRVYSLPEAGYQFICPSRPGYLRTPLSVGRTFEEQAEMTVALLDALEIEQAALIGCSAGGPPAVYFARNYPDRCWGLVMGNAINAPLSRLHGLIGPLARAFFGWDWLTWFGANRIVLFILRPSLGWQTRGDPAKQARIKGMLRTIHPTSLRREGFLNDLDQFQHISAYPLEEVSVPTLVVHGTDDIVVPYAQGAASAERIPGAEFLTVEGGTHLCFISHHEIVHPVLVEFLHRHRPG
jgi:pimeloyl-ACP methyl ester carboxylesterase